MSENRRSEHESAIDSEVAIVSVTEQPLALVTFAGPVVDVDLLMTE